MLRNDGIARSLVVSFLLLGQTKMWMDRVRYCDKKPLKQVLLSFVDAKNPLGGPMVPTETTERTPTRVARATVRGTVLARGSFGVPGSSRLRRRR